MNTNDALVTAVKRNDAAAVARLIEAGADVSAKTSNGWTPLHLAACVGYTDVARQLLEAGADVNAKDNDGWTPLHLVNDDLFTAVKRNDAAEVAQLIEAGADVSAKTRNGWTPLHEAACADVARLLIKAGADVNAKGNYGRTPLHLAACGGHTDVARLLIEAGADVEAKTNYGRTPLDVTESDDMEELLQVAIGRAERERLREEIERLKSRPCPYGAMTNEEQAEIDQAIEDGRAEMLDYRGWEPYHYIAPPKAWQCYRMKPESEYVTPTDEDAKHRPEVQMKDRKNGKWERGVLFGVTCKGTRFLVESEEDTDHGYGYNHCRMLASKRKEWQS
jgi:hypothetical protein